MRYMSTRDAALSMTGPQVIVRGLAPDGGLFVPERFGALSLGELGALAGLDYEAYHADNLMTVGRKRQGCMKPYASGLP